MATIVSFFIVLQIILLFFITLHDWIHVSPFTDIRALEKYSSRRSRLITSTIFFFIVFIPLLLTWLYQDHFPRWALLTITNFYGLLSLGTILSWWVPYFFGSSASHKAGFVEYRNTHHFLPKRGDNVVPNTLHVILHVQIWMCFGISLYLLLVS